MLVRDVMQTKLYTATPETTLPEARRLTGQRGIRHLPVLDGARLVGIVSDRDLKRAGALAAETSPGGPAGNGRRIGEIMTRRVLTTGPTVPVEDAARLMVAEKIGALPVTEGDRLTGLVTETDVLALFVTALGSDAPSSRLDVELGTRPSAVAEVVQAVTRAGAEIASLVTLPGAGGLREAVVRVRTIDPRPALRALEAQGFIVRGGAKAWEARG